MHSLKNTIVAVLLLGASYGIYNILSTPDTTVTVPDSIAGDFLNTDALGEIEYSDAMNVKTQPKLPEMPALKNDFNQPFSKPAASPMPSAQPIQVPPIFPPLAKQPPRSQNQFAPKIPQLKPNDNLNAALNTDRYPLKDQFSNKPGVQNYQPINAPDPAKRDADLIQALKDQVNNSHENLTNNFKSGVENAKAGFNNATQNIQAKANQATQALKSNFDQKIVKPLKGFDIDGPMIAPAANPNAAANLAPKSSPGDFGFDTAPTPPALNDSNSFGSASVRQEQRVPTDVEKGEYQLASAGTALSPAATAGISSTHLAAMWPKVNLMVEQENFRGALGSLSKFYKSQTITTGERQKLIQWLDALAGKVIYSGENNLFKQSYTIQSGESLADLARRWGVPAQLVYNVNQDKIPNPAEITAGTEIKMVTGPFNAELDLSEGKMTLFLKNLYAGRFPVQIGTMGDVRKGTYKVLAKRAEGHAYRDMNGNQFDPSQPGNGYGPHWIGLESGLCIHALNPGATTGHPGCIGLKTADASDMFGILSVGSTITVVR